MSLDREPVIHTNCSFRGCRRKKKKTERGDEREEESSRGEEITRKRFLVERQRSRRVERRGLDFKHSLALVSQGGMEEGYASVRQTGWANEAGLLGQDMMSKLGDTVW